MKISLISDIHLEFIKSFSIDNSDNNELLILAGDIGYPKSSEFKQFINECCKLFQHVFFITGNHEYYRNYINEINNFIKEEFKHLVNFHFLQNSIFNYKDVIFWGGTLWSNIPSDKKFIVKSKINDFSLINEFSVDEYNKLHLEAIESINNFISNPLYKNYKKVIISHHAPLINNTSDIKYTSSLTNCVFSSNLSHLVEKVDYWFFGHTHFKTEFFYKKTKLVTNAKGYPGELKDSKIKIIYI